MNQMKNVYLKKNKFNLCMAIIFMVAAGGIVAAAPAIFALLAGAMHGRITSIIIIFSILILYILSLAGIFRCRWSILFPSYFLIGFVFISLATNIYTNSDPEFRWLLPSFALPLIYIALTGFFRRFSNLRTMLLGIIVVAFLIVCLLTYTDSTGTFPSLNGIFHSRYRVFMLGNQYGPVTLSTISSTLLILTLGYLLLFSPKSHISRIFLYIISVQAIISVIFAGGRMAWLSTVLSLFIMILLSIAIFHKKKYFSSPGVFLIFGLLLCAILFSVKYLDNYIIQRFLTLFSVLANPTSDVSLNTRTELWHDALKLANDHPLGVGYFVFAKEYGLSTHNEYLNIFLGSGIIGFILFYCFYFLNIFLVFKALLSKTASQYKNLLIIIFPILIHISLISLTESWSNSNSFAAAMFWVLFSIGAISARMHDQTTKYFINKEMDTINHEK